MKKSVRPHGVKPRSTRPHTSVRGQALVDVRGFAERGRDASQALYAATNGRSLYPWCTS